MKAVVIYKSKTGYTRKYAEWIAEALGADIFDVSKVTPNMLTAYDAVIYGGSLHAVGISGLKMITKNFDQLEGKKLAVFATGCTPPREEAIREVVDRNFTPEQQKAIRFFYFRGGFNYSKLPPFDKLLMNLLKWKINNKKRKNLELTADEKGMLAIFNKPVDYTNKKYIDDMIAYIRS